MESFGIDPVILSEDQKIELAYRLQKPDMGYVKELREQQERIDRTISYKQQGKDIVWNIKELDLSFIDHMLSEERLQTRQEVVAERREQYISIVAGEVSAVKSKDIFLADEYQNIAYSCKRTINHSTVRYEEQKQMDYAA